MKIYEILFSFLFTFFLFGCGAKYSSLFTIDQLEPDFPENSIYNFDYDSLQILWSLGTKSFNLELVNKSSIPIKILWDECVILGLDGNNYRVVHSGIKYVDVNSPQVPTVVLPNSKLVDAIFITDGIKYDAYTGWKTSNILPACNLRYFQNVTDCLNSNLEKTFKIALAVEKNSTKKIYIFSFIISGYKIFKYNFISNKETLIFEKQ